MNFDFKKLYPFMDEEDVDELVQQVIDGDIDISLAELAPFASEEKLGEAFVSVYRDKGEFAKDLLPFVPEESLSQIVTMRVENNGAEISESILPFLDSRDIKRLLSFELKQRKNQANSDKND